MTIGGIEMDDDAPCSCGSTTGTQMDVCERCGELSCSWCEGFHTSGECVDGLDLCGDAREEKS